MGKYVIKFCPLCTFINFTEGPEQKGWLMVIMPCILNTPAGYYRRRSTCTIYNAPTAGKLITSNQDIVKTFFSIAAAYVKLTPPINLNKESVKSFKVNFPSLISKTSRPRSTPTHKMWRQKRAHGFPFSPSSQTMAMRCIFILKPSFRIIKGGVLPLFIRTVLKSFSELASDAWKTRRREDCQQRPSPAASWVAMILNQLTIF